MSLRSGLLKAALASFAISGVVLESQARTSAQTPAQNPAQTPAQAAAMPKAAEFAASAPGKRAGNVAQRSGAQGVNASYYDGKRPVAPDALTPAGTQLFGEQVNLYNGALSFEQSDLNVPGNDALPVALARRYVPGRKPWVRGPFGDWDLALPRISGTFGALGWLTGDRRTSRCSGYSAPPAYNDSFSGGGFSPIDYWQGTSLDVPGAGSQELLLRAPAFSDQPQDGLSYPLVTRGNWQVSCLANVLNAGGEGFVAVSPEGVRYTFNWMATRVLEELRKGNTSTPLVEHFLFASEVKDRFGNWVRYHFDPANPMNLLRIEGSDGRSITLQYVGGRIASANDGTRTIWYGYNAQSELTAAALPDGSRWTFNLAPMLHPYWESLGEGAKCTSPGVFPQLDLVGTMVHPSGATGTFTTRFVGHGKTFVEQACRYLGGTSGQTLGAVWPLFTRSQTLVKKELTGPGLNPMVWSYAYASDSGWLPCTTCVGQKVVTITQPDATVSRHIFGNRWRINEGQLLRVEEGWNGTTALRTTNHRYRQPAGQRYPERFGESLNVVGDWLSAGHRPEDQRVVTQQGMTFTRQVDNSPDGFDRWARPVLVHKSSSLNHSRLEATQHHDNTAKWVLGQVASLSVNGVNAQSTDYDVNTALPVRRYEFGLLVGRLGYHGSGLLASTADAVNPPTTLNDHFRGVPRAVAYPDGRVESAVVSNLGRVTSYTNAAGTTTTYGYDAMNRLASISYPSEATGGYHPTTVTYSQVPNIELGLAAGHWRQTVATGSRRTVYYFDALWRERVRHTYEEGHQAATGRAVETRFDLGGRKSFSSYPQRYPGDVDTYRPGQSWVHDALDRVVSQSQDSELGTLTTTTGYLDGFMKRVTNPRGHATIFGYQAFDQPSEDSIVSISAPEGVNVAIPRDVFGKPSAITRSGGGAIASRSYVYDLHQRLCKTVEPETGATIQAYDAAGNLVWRASGLGSTGTGACDQGSVGGGSKINFGYDTRNRLTATSFGDGQPGITRSYTADSLLQQIVSSSFTWTYVYNNRRLLEQELFSMPGQAPGAGWNFSYGINGYGNVSSLSDPWGAMQYAPNALGEPTQVSGYASGVSYHPNGAVAGYTLANGISRSVAQNLRGLPAQWVDAGVLNDLYTYDSNGNLAGIQDAQLGINTRSMGYDGLDRLTSANGPWGSGAFGYDALDNLTYSQLGARTLTHHIDPTTNRLSSLSGSQSVVLNYDPRGNVGLRGGQGYTFDIGNRMRAAWGKAIYDYDGHGRRSWVVFADGSTQLNAYSGTGAAGQLRFSGHSVKGNTRYVYLGDKLIAEVNSQTGTSFSHTDALGSPVARTNGSGGVIERTRYEPYGATVAGSTNPANIGFTGHVNDVDTGLVYMQQRYYDPVAGRFLSVDPVTTDASTGSLFNRYNYAYNNPYRFKDPDGRFGVVGFLAGAAFEALAQWSVTGSVSDWTAVGVAGAVGTVTGGVGGYAAKAALTGATTAGKAIAATGLVGGAAAAGGKHAEAALKGGTASAAEAGVAAAGGTLVQCAALFCTYPAVAARAALARVTLAKMSLALAVQMNGLGSML